MDLSASEYLAGHQFEYDFDNIGNRTTAKAGGDPAGGGMRNAIYTANSLNQITERTVPGAFDVIGKAAEGTIVSVNNQRATRQGEWWRHEETVDNSDDPVFATVNIVGVKNNVGASGEDAVTEESGSVYVAETPETFTYDYDGNLTSDGRWTYTWDAENRLIAMESISSVPAAAKKKLAFEYDYRWRRTSKKVYSWNTGTSDYNLAETRSFIYGEWNLIAELDGSGDLSCSYVWGNDLSGNRRGAGGVGGLVMVDHDTEGEHFAGYDGNGNVMSLVNAEDSSIVAMYEYGPFGEPLRMTGPMAEVNHFGFSTKYQDGETGFNYYGLRFYHPGIGRWISRDPIGEKGGKNLYAFVRNNPVDLVDILGLVELEVDYDPEFAKLAKWRYGSTRIPNAAAETRWVTPLGDIIRCERKARSCKVKCKLTVHFEIVIDREHLKRQMRLWNATLRGVYGHEQRHILANHVRLNQEVRFPLADEEDATTKDAADRLARDLQQKYFGIILRIRQNSPHRDPYGPQDGLSLADSLEPIAGEDHEPLPNSPYAPSF